MHLQTNIDMIIVDLIMDHFNIPGTVRASFSFYNTKSEIDLFIDAIEKASKMLG